MKKYLKNLLYITIVTIISILGIATVYAATGEKITLDKKTYINLVSTRKEAKFHTTAGYGWCVTPEKKGADQGTTFTSVGEVNDGGILYLLDKSATDDRSYLVTQLAIWLYQSNYMPDTYWNNSGSQIVKDAKALSATAKNNKGYNTTPTISVANANKTMKLVKEGNTYYYVSNDISASIKNASTYKVTLTNAPTGTKILDTNNAEKSSFTNGAKFKIKVPETSAKAAKTMKITVSATGTRKYLEKYRPSNTAKQDIVILKKEDKTVSATTEVTISPEKRVCQIFNGTYYGENGAIVDKDTYNKQCNHICEIYKGKYYGEDGKETDKAGYEKQCKHTCEIYKGKYYGEDGKETDKEGYEKQCKHTCEVYKGKYYGEDGKETTEEEYNKQCNHVCEVYKGKYYGEDGKETTEEEYNKQCNHVCEEYKGKYFDSLGKETTLEEYIRQCKHICELYNGKYYGKGGEEVDEQTYNNECKPEPIPVPSTGSNKMPLGMYLLIGLLPIAGGTKLILKTKKEN